MNKKIKLIKKYSNKDLNTAYNDGYQTAIKNLRLARQCLHTKMIYCYNEKCLNKSCPLNKEYK